MIYNPETPDVLEQGDICKNLPKITPTQINFSEIESKWIENIKAILPKTPISLQSIASPSNGVVLTQSCDIRPGSSILFAQLMERKESFTSDTKRRLNQIRKILHDETRFHYFPASKTIDFLNIPKILDFTSLFLVPYEFLHNNLDLFFAARLINDARQVLCEKISRFFTRLAFEDVMFFNDNEILEYIKNHEISLDEINKTLSLFNRIIKREN